MAVRSGSVAVLYLLAAFLSAACSSRPPSSLIQQGVRLRPVSLTGVSAASHSGGSLKLKAQGQASTAAKTKLPSGWFGDFSQDESTYTVAGLDASREDPEYSVKYGRDPSLAPPNANPEVFHSEFFHESPGGGATAAWQTNFPSVSSQIAGNRGTPENLWEQTADGWIQKYRTMEGNTDVGPDKADWFDNSVRNVDGFGRTLTPNLLDGARYTKALGWLERSVNTTLKCKESGCTARSSLQLFDASKEEARLCSLSIDLHATDYDDDFSHEVVEFFKVNGYVANRDCNPRARGCNATAEKPLYPCLNGFNVDKIVHDNGTLLLEGKNSIMVDECPYQENLLSGVAMATCMVRNKKANAVPTTPKPALFTMDDLLGVTSLNCSTPGCTAHSTVYVSPALALNGGKCTMNISVWQTDFEHANEKIDFIQVEGANVSSLKANPGKNPCNRKYKGQNTSADEMIFKAVHEYDVTELVKKSHPLGALSIKGKISDLVDECGHEGMLLSSNVTVRCVPPAKFAVEPPAAGLLHAPHAPKPDAAKPALTLLQGGARRPRSA